MYGIEIGVYWSESAPVFGLFLRTQRRLFNFH